MISGPSSRVPERRCHLNSATSATIAETVLRTELARSRMTRAQLAKLLGHPASTVSSWLRGVVPALDDLGSTLEQVLGLQPGALAGKVR